MRRHVVAVVLCVVSLAGVPPAEVGAQAPGRIVYSTYLYDEPRPKGAVFTIGADGEGRARLTKAGGHDHFPSWSPDRTRIAFERYSWRRNLDVWVMDADGSDKRRLTLGRSEDTLPQWSPDGSRIAWVKRRKDADVGRIYVMNADGTGKTLVAERSDAWNLASWSPDGSKIAYVWRKGCVECEDADVDLRVVEADGTGETVLAHRPAGEYEPIWSPDGGRIAFSRARPQGYDVYEVAPDGSGERLIASFDGIPLFKKWSPDGTLIALTVIVELDPFELRLDHRLAVLDVAAGEKRMLTEVETGGWRPDWAPDGSEIAFLGTRQSGEIMLVEPDGENLRPLGDVRGDVAWLDW